VSPHDLPFHVLALLQERISGIDELDALLLVRSDVDQAWTASAVAERLGRADAWSRPALERLCEAELLEGVGPGAERRYAYRPGTWELDAAVSMLATIYEERRTDVLRVLNEDAVERIRMAAVKAFTDARDVRRKARPEEDAGPHEDESDGHERDGA
jgi:hypothetical protein